MAEASGRKISCGKDGIYSLDFTCVGLDCPILQGFLGFTCTTEGNSLRCNNGVTCDPDSALLISEFIYTQDASDFYLDRKIKLPHCEFSVAIGSNLTEPFVHSDTCATFQENSTSVTTLSSTSIATVDNAGPGTQSSGLEESISTEIASSETDLATGSLAQSSPSTSTMPRDKTPTVAVSSTSSSVLPLIGIPTPTVAVSSTSSSALPSNGIPTLTTSPGARRHFPNSFLAIFLLLSIIVNGVLASDVEFCDRLTSPRALASPLGLELDRRATYKETMKEFKGMWVDWYEGKLMDVIKGEADWEDMVDFFSGGFISEIQETACSEVLNLVLDPLIEKAGLDKAFEVLLKPLTSKCARKIRRFARKFRADMKVRLAIVFGGSLACDLLEDAIVENVLPMHPDSIKSEVSDVICGGDSEDDCKGIDLLSDPLNCAKCKRKCSTGEKCIHGICSMQYCNGMIFGSSAEPCSPECGCTSTQWGAGICVKQESCVGAVPNECESHDDCGQGEVCGMASGCDAFLCLDGNACIGQGPWLIPDVTSSSPTSTTPPTSSDVTSPSSTSTTPLTSSTKSIVSVSNSASGVPTPTSSPGTVGWVLVLHSEEFSNYMINDWSLQDIFLDAGGRKTVQTRCVTIAETSYAAGLPDESQIDPNGNALGFDSTPDEGSEACCFAWYEDDKCSSVAEKSGTFCGDGMAEFSFSVRSWKVYGCNGWWTGPPQE